MAKHYYVPEPYPDELIGSIMVRAGRHLGLPIKRMHQYFGLLPKSHWALLFQTQIQRIASALAKPAEELLFSHTPFPFVTAFLSQEQTSRLASYYLSPHATSSALSQSVMTGGAFPRYCEACIADDRREFGEDYWHRRHNLPFITQCWKHRLSLKVSERRGAGISVVGLPHEQTGTTVSPTFDEHIHALIEPISIALLDLTPRRPPQEWQREYRETAEKRGFPHQGRQLSAKAITKGVIAFFGEKQLKHAGISVQDKHNPWPVTLLRLSETTHITAKHVLMQAYLQSAPVPEALGTITPGKKSLDCRMMDPVFALAIREHMSKQEKGARISVTKLLSQLDILQPVRHHRQALPLTAAAIVEFRESEFSERKVGRRPRKK